LEEHKKRYSRPEKYTTIARDGWYVLFDPVQFSYTRVNEHGKAILEAVGQETTAAEITALVAAKYGFDPYKIESQVVNFLDNMTATGFLHEGPYKPDSTGPDMDQIKPQMLYIHPTFRCNLKCIYCYNKEDRQESDQAELSAEEWFDVLDQARDMGVENIVFTGGEPLLRKDTLEIAKYANSIGLSSQMLTNATLITADNIKDIVNTFGSIGLSLDSHIRENNDFLRGRGAYDKTINAIRLLKEREHSFNIKAVITKYNVDDLPGFHKYFLDEFGCGSINAGLYVPTSMGDTQLLPDPEDYRRVTAEASAIVEDYYREDRISAANFHGIPTRSFQCGAALGEFAISPDGSVYPCQALLKDEFYAGNISERSLREIFNEAPIMKKLRGCTVDNIDICRDCDVKGICSGGCRSLAYNLYGQIDCHNAYFCDNLRYVAQNVLWKAACVPVEQLKKMQEEKVAEKEAGG
jgi:radical SAM protein with 4Fe4S-binding SPASM domain